MTPDEGGGARLRPSRTALAAVAFAALLAPTTLFAQDARVGLAAGAVTARYDAPATSSFEDRTGFGVGVFADVLVTPLRPLRVRIGGRWLRRGGDLSGGGGAEMDLLDVPLSLGVRLPVGPAALRPTAGVAVAYPIRIRRSADVEAGFADDSRGEVTGFVGLDLEVDLPRTLRLGVEGRLVRGLSAAFEGRAGRLDTRATEIVVRLSRPLG
ncbi:MAG: PorT family protein [Gemmatimonadetes bacterium]|nr:PorT family protein [Gemmatimonadota bacterium]